MGRNPRWHNEGITGGWLKIENHLRAVRELRGFSAAALAGKAGVSRQTIYAIEAGSYMPNTLVALRLSRALETTLEGLFHLNEEVAPGAQEVDLLPGGEAEQGKVPVELCRVDKRTMAVSHSPIAWQLPLADAIVLEYTRKKRVRIRARVQPFQEKTKIGNRVLMAGCDPAMSILARHAGKAGFDLVLAQRNSSQALHLLRSGLIHVAGSHLRDDATGESNLAQVRKLFPRGGAAVIAFAEWEQGIVVARGNPKSIRDVSDFARKGIGMVNRELGSGSRLVLDRGLKRLGIPSAKVTGYNLVTHGHLPAAGQVREGRADCCIATRSAAKAFGLDFVPLLTERYDLIIRKRHLVLPGVQILLDSLSKTSLRREIEAVGGYDTSGAGRRLA